MSDRAAAPLTPGPRPATPKLPQGPQLCGGHATECPPLRPNAGHRAQFASEGAEAWVWKGAVGTAVVGGAGQRRGSLLPTLLAKGLRRRNYPACVQRGLISHGPICCWGGVATSGKEGMLSQITRLWSPFCVLAQKVGFPNVQPAALQPSVESDVWAAWLVRRTCWGEGSPTRSTQEQIVTASPHPLPKLEAGPCYSCTLCQKAQKTCAYPNDVPWQAIRYRHR